MREIGSEFWDVPIKDPIRLFPESTQWYLSGRSALQAIISELREAKSVAMPSWCCDSMVKPFVNAELAVQFYPVWFDNEFHQKPRYDCDVLFLLEYFGHSTPQSTLSRYHGVIIRDVTHSVFSSSFSDADYYFGSLRKWCGVWTGGYAWTRDGHNLMMGQADGNKYASLRETAMLQKADYINGLRTDKGYLRLFNEAEELLENVSIAPADERDIDLMNKLDVEFIKKRRRCNANVLRKAFSEMLIFKNLKETDCPMFVPILVPDGKRDELRRYLISKGIYCPVHWPVSKYHELNETEQFIYNNELSLVCDQRYTLDDMKRMVMTIKQFMEA